VFNQYSAQIVRGHEIKHMFARRAEICVCFPSSVHDLAEETRLRIAKADVEDKQVIVYPWRVVTLETNGILAFCLIGLKRVSILGTYDSRPECLLGSNKVSIQNANLLRQINAGRAATSTPLS